MKCAKCHIHYDDDARECPMCGTRKPIISSQAVRPTPARPVSDSAPVPRPAVKAQKAKPASASISPPEKPARAGKNKGKTSPVLIIIIIFILLQLIPAIIAGLTASLTHESYESIPEYEASISPAPDYSSDDGYLNPAFPQSGIWTGDGLQISISATPEDEYGGLRYAVQQGGLEEIGYYHAYPLLSEDGWEFPAAFPEQDFAWWSIDLYPYYWRAEGVLPEGYTEPEGYGELGSSLSVFLPHEGPAEGYFISDYLPIPWFAPEALLRMDHAGDAEEANALIVLLEAAFSAEAA